MFGATRRCDAHGTVLTTEGTCVLCARRTSPPAKPGRALHWLLFGVTGGALALIVGYRIHLALADRATTVARPEPPVAPAAVNEAASPTASNEATADRAPAPIDRAPTSTDRAGPTANDRAEHERLVADAARSVTIDVYGAGWCPSCQKTRAWLDASSIPYTYRDTDRSVNAHMMRALNPQGTIPTIDIEGQVVVGYRPQAIQRSIRQAAESRVAKSGR